MSDNETKANSGTVKKEYSKPTITRWGTVTDLTEGGLGLAGDGLIGSQGTSSSTH